MGMKSFKNDSGATAMVFALALVPLMMGGGVAIDYMRMANFQGDLQGAVDTAALAGAAYHRGSDTQRRTAATNAFNANKPTGETVVLATFVVTSTEVTVTATSDVKMTFMNIGWGNGIDARGVVATGTAAMAGDPPPCIEAINPGALPLALEVGVNSHIIAPTCAVRVASTHNTNAAMIDNNSAISAASTCVKGHINLHPASDIDPDPTSCGAITDPLLGLTAPSNAASPCDFNNQVYQRNNGTGVGVTAANPILLSPGVYCGTTRINSNTFVRLLPNVGNNAYVFRNGNGLDINSNSEVAGTNVLLYFTGGNSFLNVNSESDLIVSGRQAYTVDHDADAATAEVPGDFIGMTIFQENVNAGGPPNIINSNGDTKIEGVVYMPERRLIFNSNSDSSVSAPWTRYIVDSLELNSNTDLTVNANFGASSVPVPSVLWSSMFPLPVRLTN